MIKELNDKHAKDTSEFNEFMNKKILDLCTAVNQCNHDFVECIKELCIDSMTNDLPSILEENRLFFVSLFHEKRSLELKSYFININSIEIK